MTPEDARERGAATAEAAKIVLPIENAYERRAIALRMAIDTEIGIVRSNEDARNADDVIETARKFQAFIESASVDEHPFIGNPDHQVPGACGHCGETVSAHRTAILYRGMGRDVQTVPVHSTGWPATE